MSIPAAWPQVLDFFGTRLVIEPSPGQLSGDAGLPLRRDGVNWGRGRFLVHSPKTEHHEGGADRWVPIVPERRPYLEDAFGRAAPGTVFLIKRYRHTNANLRTQLLRRPRRAGLELWPKLFQNLRASRETELAAAYTLHIVCAWIGNSALMVQKQDVQVTEGDFERATAPPRGRRCRKRSSGGAKCGAVSG
jgi:hypothetical protein